MIIDTRTALGKIAKMAITTDNIAKELPPMLNQLETEFQNVNVDGCDSFDTLLQNVREVWEFTDDDAPQNLIYLGPFSFKLHTEYPCLIKGCKKLPIMQEFNYSFCMPVGDNAIKTLEQVKQFYHDTSYVERYAMIFGFTSAKKNAKQAFLDFVAYYLPDFKQVGKNVIDEE